MLLICLCLPAWAEGGVNVEVIRMDGVSVVVLTAEETMLKVDFVLPAALTLIGDGAFEGIAARCVEVSENVAAIEAHAFANCKHLREIYIPATVLKVDDRALEGCENVTVYGVKGSEAERFAKAAGFVFVDPGEQTEPPHKTPAPPVVLPFVPRK